MHIMEASEGACTAKLNGDSYSMLAGDSFVVRPGDEYNLQNNSVTDYVQVKMVLLKHEP